MGAEIGAGPNCYEKQLRAMSMCWPGFEPATPYAVTPNYPCQAATYQPFPVTIATRSDQQIVHQFHPHNFAASFAQQLTTLSFNANNMSSTSPLASTEPPPAPIKKKPVPVPENLKDEAYRERRIKNNESARRSREMRRQKEESTQRRCDQLLHENQLLRTELSLLRSQVEHFRQIMSISSRTQPHALITCCSAPIL